MPNLTRFDRINGAKPKPAPKKRAKKLPEGVEEKEEIIVLPLDRRSLRDRVTAGVYDTSQVMPWPGHKPRDPEVMASKKRYAVIASQLRERFKQDLFEEHGVKFNPKRELCFEKAWNLGDGLLHEVILHFEDLVELIE